MQPLSCPIPSNINPLQSNGFLFSINKLPELTYFCQEVSLPELSLPNAEFVTPFTDIHVAGDKPNYGDLTVTFLVDEDMANYVAVHEWLIGMGFPESRDQYSDFIADQPGDINRSPAAASVSDGVLLVLNSSNRPARTIQFVDLLPVSLSSIVLTTTSSDTQYIAGVATFRYTLYRFI